MTSKPSPRYCAIVFAFAGDSTMTSFLLAGMRDPLLERGREQKLPSATDGDCPATGRHAHHTQVFRPERQSLPGGCPACRVLSGGGPARADAVSGRPNSSSATVTVAVVSSRAQPVSRVPFRLAIRAASSHG